MTALVLSLLLGAQAAQAAGQDIPLFVKPGMTAARVVKDNQSGRNSPDSCRAGVTGARPL